MSTDVLKILGLVTTIVGAIASVAGNLIGQKQQENLIAEKAQEAVANLLSEES